MKTEELIRILEEHPGKDVFVHQSWKETFSAEVLGSDSNTVYIGVSIIGCEYRNLPQNIADEREKALEWYRRQVRR